jgi:tRNA G18 (ribose-2'-O)-methylase SpoU
MLFLYDIQSPINIGLILRIGEQFHIPVKLYDPRHVMNDAVNRSKIWDFSCGALDRRPPSAVQSLANYQVNNPGRVIATCLNRTAIPLPRFAFEASDIILLGNEYDGLPEKVIAKADAALYIPLPPGFLPKPPSHLPIDPARDPGVTRRRAESQCVDDGRYHQLRISYSTTGSLLEC